ncbi:hypothetical protein MK805_07910 [Shimazuella sp. AN120528]|uniref:hypothetical protein n=1 Tax=Shimazuella soli TaxID=1892854 RepID=UPI001F0FBAC8|nr:hypothetical protein [Shimazuella soli]MCH5584897.1 hypothetical protein [Shimazuella soli]
MDFYPKAATPAEAEELISLLPKLEQAATTNHTLPIQHWKFVKVMVQRLLFLTDAELREVLDYSSLADFYNIGLLGVTGDLRDLQLRLNIYPDFPGDVEFHTHRTRVSSLVLAGALTNSMFDSNTINQDVAGDYRIVKPTRTSGKSKLFETGFTGFKPEVTTLTHRCGVAYSIPVEHFHSVTTTPNTVTLCLFRKDLTGFRDSLILKKRGATLTESQPRPLSPNVLELVRGSLNSVLH